MATLHDFEALSVGDLNGQDGFSGGTTFDVTTALAQAGSKSVVHNTTGAGFATCVRSYTAAASGTLTWYYYWTSGNARTYFIINNSSGVITYFGTRNSTLTAFHSGGEYSFGNPGTSAWHKLDFEWNGTTFRVRLNDGAWSSNLSTYTGSGTTPISFGPCAFSSTNGSSYWDSISDDTVVGGTPYRSRFKPPRL